MYCTSELFSFSVLNPLPPCILQVPPPAVAIWTNSPPTISANAEKYGRENILAAGVLIMFGLICYAQNYDAICQPRQLHREVIITIRHRKKKEYK